MTPSTFRQAKDFAHPKPTLSFPGCCPQLCYTVEDLFTFREEAAAGWPLVPALGHLLGYCVPDQ